MDSNESNSGAYNHNDDGNHRDNGLTNDGGNIAAGSKRQRATRRRVSNRAVKRRHTVALTFEDLPSEVRRRIVLLLDARAIALCALAARAFWVLNERDRFRLRCSMRGNGCVCGVRSPSDKYGSRFCGWANKTLLGDQDAWKLGSVGCAPHCYPTRLRALLEADLVDEAHWLCDRAERLAGPSYAHRHPTAVRHLIHGWLFSSVFAPVHSCLQRCDSQCATLEVLDRASTMLHDRIGTCLPDRWNLGFGHYPCACASTALSHAANRNHIACIERWAIWDTTLETPPRPSAITFDHASTIMSVAIVHRNTVGEVERNALLDLVDRLCHILPIDPLRLSTAITEVDGIIGVVANGRHYGHDGPPPLTSAAADVLYRHWQHLRRAFGRDFLSRPCADPTRRQPLRACRISPRHETGSAKCYRARRASLVDALASGNEHIMSATWQRYVQKYAPKPIPSPTAWTAHSVETLHNLFVHGGRLGARAGATAFGFIDAHASPSWAADFAKRIGDDPCWYCEQTTTMPADLVRHLSAFTLSARPIKAALWPADCPPDMPSARRTTTLPRRPHGASNEAHEDEGEENDDAGETRRNALALLTLPSVCRPASLIVSAAERDDVETLGALATVYKVDHLWKWEYESRWPWVAEVLVAHGFCKQARDLCRCRALRVPNVSESVKREIKRMLWGGSQRGLAKIAAAWPDESRAAIIAHVEDSTFRSTIHPDANRLLAFTNDLSGVLWLWPGVADRGRPHQLIAYGPEGIDAVEWIQDHTRMRFGEGDILLCIRRGHFAVARHLMERCGVPIDAKVLSDALTRIDGHFCPSTVAAWRALLLAHHHHQQKS